MRLALGSGSLWVALAAAGGCAPEAGNESAPADGVPATAPGGGAGAPAFGTGGSGVQGPAEPGPFNPVGAGGSAGAGVDPNACRSIPVRSESIQVQIEVPVEVPVEVPIEVQVEVQVPYEVRTQKPTALYVMLDRSTSMNDTVAGGTQTLWQNAVGALSTFVNDPTSTGMRIALAYFPIDGQDYGVPFLPGPACGAASGAPHNAPVVPMGDLPANAGNITGSLNGTALTPFGLTPTEPALRGADAYCASYKTQNAGWDCIAVLVTDGAPTNCNGDPNVISGLAGTARTSSGVTTFAVGMGQADFNLLNAIATQGGGDCDPQAPGAQACNVTTGPQAFLDALRRIREVVSVEVRTETRTEVRTETHYETRIEIRTETQWKPLPCEFGIPDPPQGEHFDKEKVNVKVTYPGGGEQTVGKVPAEAECAAFTGGGWFYDDPNAPTRIKVCPETCTMLQSLQGPSVDILLGCKSEPASLR